MPVQCFHATSQRETPRVPTGRCDTMADGCGIDFHTFRSHTGVSPFINGFSLPLFKDSAFEGWNFCSLPTFLCDVDVSGRAWVFLRHLRGRLRGPWTGFMENFPRYLSLKGAFRLLIASPRPTTGSFHPHQTGLLERAVPEIVLSDVWDPPFDRKRNH